MNKFAKYVPEEDKKKQREHIGAMGTSELPFRSKIIIGTIYEHAGVSMYTEPNGGAIDDWFEVASEFVLGESYTVIWDGVTYDNLVAHEFDSYICIGAETPIYNMITEDLPFCLYVEKPSDSPGKCFVRGSTCSTESSHDITIIGPCEDITTLPSKFLPRATTDVLGAVQIGVDIPEHIMVWLHPQLRYMDVKEVLGQKTQSSGTTVTFYDGSDFYNVISWCRTKNYTCVECVQGTCGHRFILKLQFTGGDVLSSLDYIPNATLYIVDSTPYCKAYAVAMNNSGALTGTFID